MLPNSNLASIYQNNLGRSATGGAENPWQKAIDSGQMTMEEAAAHISASPEAQRYKSLSYSQPTSQPVSQPVSSQQPRASQPTFSQPTST